MAGSRKRQIFKWTTMVLLGIVLLLASYIACFGLVAWYAGSVPPALELNRSLFAPVVLYMRSDFPGAVTLSGFFAWCYLNGSGIDASWDLCVWHSTNWARHKRGQEPIPPPPGLLKD